MSFTGSSPEHILGYVLNSSSVIALYSECSGYLINANKGHNKLLHIAAYETANECYTASYKTFAN